MLENDSNSEIALLASPSCFWRRPARSLRSEVELSVWMRGKTRRLMLGSITVKTQYAMPRSLSRNRKSMRARDPKIATCVDLDRYKHRQQPPNARVRDPAP